MLLCNIPFFVKAATWIPVKLGLWRPLSVIHINIKICKIYEYESYYKVYHYTYKVNGNIDPGGPIYFKKSEVKEQDKVYW